MAGTLDKKEMNKRPINLLLVDDNEADVKIALRAFSKAEAKNDIYVANDGQEALDFVYNQGKYKDENGFPTPDLILLDIKMPRLDGFEVLKKLKSDPQYDFIPVIILTSSKEEEDIIKSYKSGAAGFIPKPVNYEDFVKIIDGFNFYWHIVNKLSNPKMCKE